MKKEHGFRVISYYLYTNIIESFRLDRVLINLIYTIYHVHIGKWKAVKCRRYFMYGLTYIYKFMYIDCIEVLYY